MFFNKPVKKLLKSFLLHERFTDFTSQVSFIHKLENLVLSYQLVNIFKE